MRQFSGNENEVFDLLDDVVIEFTNAAKSFTAYDVSVEARKRTDIEFFHRDVAKHIHSAVRHIAPAYGVRNHASYQAREYYDTVVALRPVPQSVGLPTFNHGNVAVSKGILKKTPNFGVGASFVAAVVNAGNAIKNFGQASGNAVSTTASPRSEGRVLIPATVVRFVVTGHRHNDDFLVVEDVKPGELTLVPGSKSQNFAGKKKYHIDKYKNIRLTKRTLKKAGLEGKDVVLVAHADKIVITEK